MKNEIDAGLLEEFDSKEMLRSYLISKYGVEGAKNIIRGIRTQDSNALVHYVKEAIMGDIMNM